MCLVAVYMFFCCMYVVFCSVNDGITHNTASAATIQPKVKATLSTATKPAVKLKSFSRPRIILKKRLVQAPPITVLSNNANTFLSFRSVHLLKPVGSLNQWPLFLRNLQVLFSTWQI